MTTKTSLIVSSLLVIVGVSARLIPHVPNLTPITAIALFSASYLSLRYSFGIFLITMVLTDALIGFYQWQIMLAVYGSFALAGLIGLMLRNRKNPRRIFASALSSSVLFFFITNWAVWQFGSLYIHSFSGLIQSYVMAIPFFKYSLAGDLFYTGAFFGVFELVRTRHLFFRHSLWKMDV